MKVVKTYYSVTTYTNSERDIDEVVDRIVEKVLNQDVNMDYESYEVLE